MEQTRKHSRKRDAILSCLRGTKSHPSAEWVYRQLKPELPDLSLGTVYRNLALFKREGLIQTVAVVDGLERFDADTSEHLHLICTGCGAVLDAGRYALPDSLRTQVCTQTDAEITGAEITFYGLCRECRGKAD